jgi:pantothenate kinase type III
MCAMFHDIWAMKQLVANVQHRTTVTMACKEQEIRASSSVAQINEVARNFCGQYFNSLPNTIKKDAQLLDFSFSNFM